MELSRILLPMHISPRNLRLNINDMATEVLAIIFGFCVQEASTTWHGLVELPMEAPVLLTHICSRWRQVAINAPGLWTQIYILVDNIPPLTLAQLIEDVWLSRSGGTLPLDLSIHVDNAIIRHPQQHRVWHFLNDLLCRYHPFFSRLRRLSLDDVMLVAASSQPQFFTLPDLDTTNLVELDFRSQSQPPFHETISWMLDILPNFQNLRSISWFTPGLEDVQRFLEVVPLSDLEHLKLDPNNPVLGIKSVPFRRVLSTATHLLTLHIVICDDPEFPSPTPLVHNNIKVLKVGVGQIDGDHWNFPNPLDSISLPALGEFELIAVHSGGGGWQGWDASRAVDFIKRSQCPLTVLTFETPPDLESIYQFLAIESVDRNLTQLNFSNFQWAEWVGWFSITFDDVQVYGMKKIIQHINTPRNGTTRLPRLTELSVWIDPFDGDGIEALFSLVDQRLPLLDEGGGFRPPDPGGLASLTRLTVVAVVEPETHMHWVQETGFRDKYLVWEVRGLTMFIDDMVCRESENGWDFGMKETLGLSSRNGSELDDDEDKTDGEEGGEDTDED